MFFFSTGDRVPLVITPTWCLPTWTHSPCEAGSFPSSSSPTSLRCGCSRRSATASLAASSSGQAFLAAVVVLLRLRHREADPGLEWIDLVVELRAGEHEARLDAQHVE